MNYFVVSGALKVLKARADGGMPMALGFREEEYIALTGDEPWIATERARMRGLLQALIQETTSSVGLPPMMISAEYAATVIAIYVSPVNIQVACAWMEGALPAADDLMTQEKDPVPGMEMLYAPQLVTMVYGILGGDTGPAAERFRKSLLERARNGA